MTQPELVSDRPVVQAVRSLHVRWAALRNRLLSSPRFQRWAAAFPPTRRIARRRARSLFDLVAGFVYSQVLLACVQLRLFDVLAQGPQTAEALATRLMLPQDAMRRLLAAAVALGLVERHGSALYGLGALGAPMVGNEAVAAMVEHHAALYVDLADPVALLRGGGQTTALARYWPYSMTDAPKDLMAERVSAYSSLMSASQPLVSGEVLDAYPLKAHRCLLDVGGGEGAFLVAAARRAPQLRVILFDLPAVAQRAEARFAEHGLSERAQVVGGSFFTDALPQGADIASLVRVIHDHDDPAAMSILRAVRKALAPGASLLLAEPMAGTDGAEPMGDAYFGFYLLAMGRGRPRTASELTQMLNQAGFSSVRLLKTRMPLQTRLMLAR